MLDFEMDKDICLILYFEIILDMFCLFVNCSICKDVYWVDWLFGLMKEEFVWRYVYILWFVVIIDGMRDWIVL